MLLVGSRWMRSPRQRTLVDALGAVASKHANGRIAQASSWPSWSASSGSFVRDAAYAAFAVKARRAIDELKPTDTEKKALWKEMAKLPRLRSA